MSILAPQTKPEFIVKNGKLYKKWEQPNGVKFILPSIIAPLDLRDKPKK